jgi:hypothetical protein
MGTDGDDSPKGKEAESKASAKRSTSQAKAKEHVAATPKAGSDHKADKNSEGAPSSKRKRWRSSTDKVTKAKEAAKEDELSDMIDATTLEVSCMHI